MLSVRPKGKGKRSEALEKKRKKSPAAGNPTWYPQQTSHFHFSFPLSLRPYALDCVRMCMWFLVMSYFVCLLHSQPPDASSKVPLDKDNLLLRGCTIRNVDRIVGLVVYAGEECTAQGFGHEFCRLCWQVLVLAYLFTAAAACLPLLCEIAPQGALLSL